MSNVVHVIISGQVQGLGFRRFVRNKARELNVKGWVRNLPDRRVEAVLQGRTKDVEKMIEFCRKGSFLADVVDIQIKEIGDEEFEGFEITY
ncbi:MAG: acylphosphatase [Candidatus Levybacteria bacterium]|nr:acylphosphatase [Candidatus Levybacteria bacterium]